MIEKTARHPVSCTHAELVAQVVALGTALEAFKDLMAERDKRYDDRAGFQDRAVESAMVTSKEAIKVAAEAVDRRLEGLNELRGMALDQAGTFARAEEVRLALANFELRVSSIGKVVEDRTARSGGQSSVFTLIAMILAAGASVAAILVAILSRA